MSRSLLLSLLASFLALAFPGLASGANYAKLIYSGQYDKAERQIMKDKDKMTSTSEFYAYNFWRAVLYSRADYSGRNPLTAYNIINKLQRKLLDTRDAKLVERLGKLGVNNNSLVRQADTACQVGLEVALKTNTVESLSAYLRYFELARKDLRDSAQTVLNRLAYDRCVALDTREAYEDYIANYSAAYQAQDARDRLEDLTFNIVSNTNTLGAYQLFLSQFPLSRRRQLVLDSVYAKGYRNALQVGSAQAFNTYLNLYPESPYAHKLDSLLQDFAYADIVRPGDWSSYLNFLSLFPSNKSHRRQAVDSLLMLSLRHNVAKGLIFCLSSGVPLKNREAVLKRAYAAASRDGELQTLVYLSDKFPLVSSFPSFKADMAAAKFAASLDLRNIEMNLHNKPRIEKYIHMAGDKDLAVVALQVLIRPSVRAGQWDDALSLVKKYGSLMRGNQHYAELVEVLKRAPNHGIVVNNIGVANSSSGNQYYPVISADGKSLYFCGRDRSDNFGGEDIFVCHLTPSGWSKPEVFEPLSGKESNDGILAVSADGTQMIKFENGVMGVCRKTGKEWSPTKFFPTNINRGQWNSDATFCSDGRTLLFSSIRPSSSNFNREPVYHASNHYQSDIYMSQMDSAGNWCEPVNLGPTVNSCYSERSPFLHPDMRTLYFSSDGLGGLGGYDVYKSVRLSDSCWTCWSKPVNLGREINTDADDWTYKIATDGKMAYFSQREAGSNKSNIFSINLPPAQKPFNVVTLSGKMVDREGKIVSARVMWEDLETGRVVGEAHTDPQDGSFFIVLPTGKMYGVFVNDSAVYPETRHLDLRKVSQNVSVEKTFNVTTIAELQQGRSITINNIFFDFGKSHLLRYSFSELNRLASLLLRMNLKVEISGHTDDVGSDEVNLKLSQDRAQSVKDYLVARGCPPGKILARGYGKLRPVASNKSENGRAKNRRVELRVIK